MRYDTGFLTGDDIPTDYDSLIAKIITHGRNRSEALSRLLRILEEIRCGGVVSNLDYLRTLLREKAFSAGPVDTLFAEALLFHPLQIEVLEGGVGTTIQDYPGREGYWDIGVCPSGPMDSLVFRIANRLVGNDENCAGLEFLLEGPVLRFSCDAVVALAGARTEAALDGQGVSNWSAFAVKKGQTLSLRNFSDDGGSRAYLAVRGGLDIPLYLGSAATFSNGRLGGLQGGPLQPGDVLPLAKTSAPSSKTPLPALLSKLCPLYSTEWDIGVLRGPHDTADLLQEEDMSLILSYPWQVHHNSNRLGIRLIGPKPKWARRDGGEAGLHPSNLHDYTYAIGSVNFTGDMPVILAQDGPSLGGFLCPVTVVRAEMWKMGQLKPGDRLRFREMSPKQAQEREQEQEGFLLNITSDNMFTATPLAPLPSTAAPHTTSILLDRPESIGIPRMVVRRVGDKTVLVEYGPLELDLAMRFRVDALLKWLKKKGGTAILELAPGVRSLTIRYDNTALQTERLIALLELADLTLPSSENIIVPSREIRLPIAFDDKWSRDAVECYTRSTGDTAPYLPNNIDFIARMNGLSSPTNVQDIMTSAEYLVLGLGDVYLGAPCAVPLDPRHRLLTSKYNPARIYTPEGCVGIGGIYMCIYGMDSPGGYQLVGRTLPIWDSFVNNPMFQEDKPWLLRFFDRIRFYAVSDSELKDLRMQFLRGKLPLDFCDSVFSLQEHLTFIEENKTSIEAFRKIQKVAFDQEITLWKDRGMIGGIKDITEPINLKRSILISLTGLWRCMQASEDF